MKKYWTSICLCISALGLGACSNYLSEDPYNKVNITDATGVTQLLENAYPNTDPALLTEMSSDNIQNNDRTTFTTSESMIEEAVGWREIQEYGQEDGLDSIWQRYYASIYRANTVLDLAEHMGNPSTLNQARGEAYVLRAYNHFMLVNLFSQPYRSSTSDKDMGIPYMLAPISKLQPHSDRGTVASVYKQITEDLEQGIPLLSDGEDVFHFSTRSASALAARVYLYMGQWSKAEEYANKVLGTGDPTGLLREWSLFAQQPAKEDAYAQEYMRLGAKGNLLVLPIQSKLYNYFSRLKPASNRYSHGTYIAERETYVADNIWGNAKEIYWVTPFEKQDNNRDVWVMPKYPVFSSKKKYTLVAPLTTDETLLVRAEARIMQGKYAEAVVDMNYWSANFLNNSGGTRKTTFTQQEIVDFYTALPYDSESAPSMRKALHPDFTIQAGEQEALLQHLLQCRRILTLHQGLRWYDIRRYGMSVVRRKFRGNQNNLEDFVSDGVLSSGDARYALQLPASVRAAGQVANPR